MAIERTIWVIRHGETEWSRSGQHTSRTDLPLLPQGRAEAAKLAPLLAKYTFSAVWVSPRARARETAELAGVGGRAEIVDDLQEWDYGTYEGRTSAEIHQIDPHWNLWRDGGPGGESAADMTTRIDRVIARIEATPGDVLLFSHGHASRVVALRWLRWPLEHGAQLYFDTTSIARLSIDRGRRVLSAWNERSHLSASPPQR